MSIPLHPSPSESLPMTPESKVPAYLPLVGRIEIGGALLLIAGFRVRPAAFVMAAFTLAAAVFFHRNFADQNQMIHFLKNIMLIGGLLNIAYFGAGPLSLDNRSK